MNRDGDGNGDAASNDRGHCFLVSFLPMPRAARKAPGGQVYHVLNRSVGRMHLFGKNAGFEAFQRVMIEAHQRHPIRILSYCVLSNHWHFMALFQCPPPITAHRPPLAAASRPRPAPVLPRRSCRRCLPRRASA